MKIYDEVRDEVNDILQTRFCIKKNLGLKPFWVAKASFAHSSCVNCTDKITKGDNYVLSAFGKFCSLKCFIEHVDKYRDRPTAGVLTIEQQSPYSEESSWDNVEAARSSDRNVANADIAIQIMWWLVREYLPSKTV